MEKLHILRMKSREAHTLGLDRQIPERLFIYVLTNEVIRTIMAHNKSLTGSSTSAIHFQRADGWCESVMDVGVNGPGREHPKTVGRYGSSRYRARVC